MRWVITRVFPLPAPAITRSGPCVWVTASSCSRFRRSRMGSGEGDGDAMPQLIVVNPALVKRRSLRLFLRRSGQQKRLQAGGWRAREDNGADVKILGTGIDIVEIARIREVYQRHSERFLDRVYTPQEKSR